MNPSPSRVKDSENDGSPGRMPTASTKGWMTGQDKWRLVSKHGGVLLQVRMHGSDHDTHDAVSTLELHHTIYTGTAPRHFLKKVTWHGV